MSTIAIKERGEVAFPEAGDGVVLRYRNSDLKRIEAAKKIGTSWFRDFIERCGNESVTFDELELYLEQGAKKGGEPFKITEDALDNIPVSPVWEKILDAICLAMKGKTAVEYFQEVFRAFEEVAEKGESPPAPPSDTTSSTISEEGAGEIQDSAPTTSGE